MTMAVDEKPQGLSLPSPFILADVFTQLSDHLQQREGSFWLRQSHALHKGPGGHCLGGHGTFAFVGTSSLAGQEHLLARAQDDAALPLLLGKLSLGWVYPQTPKPSWVFPLCPTYPLRHEKGKDAHCSWPGGPRPLPPSQP